MKHKLLITIAVIFLLNSTSCKEETKPNVEVTSAENTQSTVSTSTDSIAPANMNLWAEQVESSISLMPPEDWAPEDWNTIFKQVDRKTIYNDVVDAVLTGKQKAYNFFTDSAYTVEQVKEILVKHKLLSTQNPATKEVETKEVEIHIGPDHLSLIRVREKVYFDKEKFKIIRKPTALILYINHHSDDGEFRGYQALFYVKIS